MTFQGAVQYFQSSAMPRCCEAGVQAHLASIASQEENERFLAALRAITDFTVGVIGLNNLENPPAYAWQGISEDVGYTKWCGPGTVPFACGLQSPSRGNNSCAAMSGAGGYWVDYNCLTTQFSLFLVEYDC
jgi:hypothetical protein